MSPSEEAFQKALNDGHSAAWDQDWTKAAACYRRALQEAPDQPRALNSLGLALYQLGEFTEALQVYQQVARLSADDPVPLEKVAQISERLGEIGSAVDAAMNAAESFLRQRDIEKAIENWSRVTELRPEQALAHSRLATAHEHLGHKQRAVTEYLAVAGLLQRAGKADKAQEIVRKAAQLLPSSPEARQAMSLLRTGQLLPQPVRAKGGTGALRLEKVKQLQKPKEDEAAPLDPISEASNKALTKLAEILFDYSDDSPSGRERRGLAAIMKGTGQLSMRNAEQTKVVLHLGQAIDAQATGQDATAADELIRHLAHAVQHRDYGLGARLLLGEILFKKGLYQDASLEYLQALRLADASTVPEAQADEIREQYEPFIDTQQAQKDADISRRLCDNVRELLTRTDWREQVHRTRAETPRVEESAAFAPLAEVMLAAQSSGVVESINRVHQLARAGSLRSAMDEAYDAVQRAPNYLPLHSLMADLLMQEGRVPEAIDKLSVVAHAYGVRGEVAQASKLWRRIIELAPMDMSARSHLIELLMARGQVDKAIEQYLELADAYYRLADLDMARKTYTAALRVVQQSDADRAWNVHILQRMADIDMQRLDWKQAVRVYEQIRTLRPDDQAVRRQLLKLYTRMAQPQQTTAELENFLSYLEANGKADEAVPFLEDLAREHEDQHMFRRALAAQLHRLGRVREAVGQLDALGETLLQAGRKQEAVEIIAQIVAMNPPNAADYRRLLAQIGR
jgi:tetratricopeptide (TPR) repeat protein